MTYTYGNSTWGDLLTNYNGTSITYDAIGNPTKWRNATGLTWEARELQRANLATGAYVDYTYNSDGIRTSRSYLYSGAHYSENRKYILDGTKIIQEDITISTITALTNATLYYLYDVSGEVQGFIYNNSYYYFQKNLQGDVVRILNSSGTVVTEYTYDAWGKVLTTTGTMASTVGKYNPFRYRSYYYDTETGFYYLQSRYYDPTVGRFLNADGIVGANGGLQGYNMFAYCNNNPVMYVDETGYALKHNTVLINDGGGGTAPKINEEQPEPQTVSVKNHISTYGSYAIEFDYTYEFYDNKVTSVTLERYKVEQEPPLFSVEIVSARAEIVDWFGVDNAIKFEFILEITLTMGIPGLPKALEWLSLDIFSVEGLVSTTVAVKEVTNEQND